ncbi:MAG TPA: DNA primase [Pseudogracilibacillus sp.]|nr:DNA primase [Pseudogracilibacillus sp.]
MTTISKELINKIRQDNDIVEIIGEYVQLERKGRNYFGLCPFHEENSPSFSVTSDKQIFHCFGCGEGGSVYDFLMLKEGFSFMDAVKYLAERVNVELPRLKQEETSFTKEEKVILDANESLTKYYHFVLKNTEEGKTALQYLQDRGINESTINEMMIGFAPDDSKATVNFLLNQQFHEQELIKNGILTQSNQYVNDPFRGRVIFPIMDHLGRPIAFGGRSLGEDKPKYLNSPENAMFQKGRLLYHFHKSKNFIRQSGQAIVFEGYMDVIAAHQANIKNVVATLGTALSDRQVQMLKRYTNEIVLCYDTDDAGMNGMLQAANLIRKHHMNVKFATMRKGVDPDDFIQEHGGKAFLSQVIEPSETYFKFVMRYHIERTNLKVDSEKIALIEQLIRELANVSNEIEREIYAKEMASTFDISLETLMNKLIQLKPQAVNQYKKDNERLNRNTINTSISGRKKRRYRAFERAERLLISYMLQNEHVYDRVQAEIGNKFNIPLHQIVITHLYGHVEANKGKIILDEFLDKLSSKEEKQLITELSLQQLNEDVTDEEITDYINAVYKESNTDSRLRKLKAQLKEYERINDYESAREIAMEIIALNKSLKRINL